MKLLLGAAALIAGAALLPGASSYDVVVYGGTPGGVASAITAARLGRSVALIEYHRHLGGMTASGLGKSDIETREAIGGLFREFTQRVHRYYVDRYGPDHPNVKMSRDGYYYEPSVAEKIIDAMVAAESRIRVMRYTVLESAVRSGSRLKAIRVRDRTTGAVEEIEGRVFVDGTYEGDLAAFAGVPYRVGREGRSDFHELNAGVVYMDYDTRAFLPGTTGEGDKRVQAYTFRLCLTTDQNNSVILRDPPPNYDRRNYLGYIDDWKSGRMGPPRVMKEGLGYFGPTFNTVVRALSIAEIPNNKTDVNMNPRPLGFPFAEINYAYPEASWEEREKITAQIRNLTLGLLYFLQNDTDVPAAHRELARKYNLAKDEFGDNGNFPWQLYVREARRIVGEYTLSEHDLILGPKLGRTKMHRDSIAAGEFPIDSFPVRRREKGHDVALEGYILMLDQFTHPYQIPYRVMVPKGVDGLLVPVAASTTHVAFSTIRLEPTWMALGQAAGTAAHLALTANREVRSVDVNAVQRQLVKQGQVITFFRDIDSKDPHYEALQFWGTRGFFPDYFARAGEAVSAEDAAHWVAVFAEEQGCTAGRVGDASRSAIAQALRPCSVAIPSGAAQVTRGELAGLLYRASNAPQH